MDSIIIISSPSPTLRRSPSVSANTPALAPNRPAFENAPALGGPTTPLLPPRTKSSPPCACTRQPRVNTSASTQVRSRVLVARASDSRVVKVMGDERVELRKRVLDVEYLFVDWHRTRSHVEAELRLADQVLGCYTSAGTGYKQG
jgi:hypothetical protein